MGFKDNLKSLIEEISGFKLYRKLPNEEKDAKLLVGERSDQNRIIKESESNNTGSSTTENIKMETLSGFCRSNNVNHINYLKIDTEGFDLEVLKSGAAMLIERSIDFVEAEVGMNSTNKLHIPINKMTKFMESYEYYVLGIYEQKMSG
jgi:hypothetical protein